MKAQQNVEYIPELTVCGEGGTAAGELLPLLHFDNANEPLGDDYQPDAYGMGTESVADLLMSRAGSFGSNIHDLSKTMICRKHAKHFGVQDFQQFLTG